MPTLLLSFKQGEDGHVLIHGFLAPNGRESTKDMKAHADVCPKYGPAVKAGQTIDVEVEVDDTPDFDQESIEGWVDEMFCIEEDEEDDEDEEEEEDEE